MKGFPTSTGCFYIGKKFGSFITNVIYWLSCLGIILSIYINNIPFNTLQWDEYMLKHQAMQTFDTKFLVFCQIQVIFYYSLIASQTTVYGLWPAQHTPVSLLRVCWIEVCEVIEIYVKSAVFWHSFLLILLILFSYLFTLLFVYLQ
jgi:hypothetical protein